ncbi:MAG: type II toxin-antitoxin system HicA family toxin [Burkholderiales bacterium]
MKRRALIRLLLSQQCVLHRHGANHDIYINLRSGRKAPIPRHAEVKDSLIRLILKQFGIDPQP